MQAQPRPQTKREYLAQTISQGLNDSDRVGLYLQCCKKHRLAVIYRAFAEAKNYPQERIRKSRAALFFYLIKKYTHESKQNIGS